MLSCSEAYIAGKNDAYKEAIDVVQTILGYLDDPYKAPELKPVLIRESCHYFLKYLGELTVQHS